MSEIRKAIAEALCEFAIVTGDRKTLTEILERHTAAVVVPAKFDVRKIPIAATGDISEGGLVPIYAESVEQVFDALTAAAERANEMRRRGDMFAEASRKKAGWLLETRRALEKMTKERDALYKFKAYVHERLDKAGVPVDPELVHKANCCRIGGRLDWIPETRSALEKEIAERDVIDAAREYLSDLHFVPEEGTRAGVLAAAIARYDAAKRAANAGPQQMSAADKAAERGEPKEAAYIGRLSTITE